jgi:hypothetical protein
MVYAALLLLMLEAAKARPRFTISLKRSTPKIFIHKLPADYPIYAAEDTAASCLRDGATRTRAAAGADRGERCPLSAQAVVEV